MSRPEARMEEAGASVLKLLGAHEPADSKERADLELLRGLAGSLASPLSRSSEKAHFTGSAMVVSPRGDRLCLLLHRKLQRWLQPGGHVEPEDGGDLVQTALREAREETGLRVELHPSAPRPLDVDAHRIPARPDAPEHQHLDVRFLLVAEDADALAPGPGESRQLQWFSFAEARALVDDPSLKRMLEKAERWASPSASGA